MNRGSAQGLFLALTRATGDGWASIGRRCTSVSPGLGEVYVVGIDPTAQDRRSWEALTRSVCVIWRTALSATDTAVMLGVESDNGAALRTYENLGFSVASIDTAYSPAWKPREFTSSSPPMGFPSTRAAYTFTAVGIEH